MLLDSPNAFIFFCTMIMDYLLTLLQVELAKKSLTQNRKLMPYHHYNPMFLIGIQLASLVLAVTMPSNLETPSTGVAGGFFPFF